MRRRHGRRAPLTVAQTVAAGVELHKAGRLADARQVYEAVLARVPDQFDALQFLGMLSHQQGRKEAALALLQRAIVVDPQHAGAYNNLGNVLRRQGKLEEALAAYRRVLELDPHHADAYSNLGAALRVQGRLEEAVAACRTAVALQPDHPSAHTHLADALRKQGNFHEAVAAYRTAIRLNPRHGPTFEAFGRLFYRAGQIAEARTVFQQWSENDPANPIARHMLAACAGDAVPPRASDAYVQATFDGFADSFDENLAGLDYRAPELVAGAIASVVGDRTGQLDVLDVGCGTGLCGPHLRPYARQLVGVDLSRSMLEKASGRGVYDRLVAAELTAFLGAAGAAYDVIVSADTLVYFGDLRPALSAAARALRPGGWLAFTVEHEEEATSAGFRLNPHGRYSHTESYVRQTLADAALVPRSVTREVLRQELGEPVAGMVILARHIGGD